MCSVCGVLFIYFFFFKQKTAYEMRISDWSSDVCSSDLILRKERLRGLIPGQRDAVIQYADHIVGEGEKLLRLMCDAGQEGIIAKKADAPYSGRSEERREGKECVRTCRSRWGPDL